MKCNVTVSTSNGIYITIGGMELVTGLFLEVKTKQTCLPVTFMTGEQSSVKLILVFGITLCYIQQ